jgi:hypothetical protein
MAEDEEAGVALIEGEGLTGRLIFVIINPKKKNGQRALLLDEALEKLLTAIVLSRKSVSASSARVKFRLAWSLEVFLWSPQFFTTATRAQKQHFHINR